MPVVIHVDEIRLSFGGVNRSDIYEFVFFFFSSFDDALPSIFLVSIRRNIENFNWCSLM